MSTKPTDKLGELRCGLMVFGDIYGVLVNGAAVFIVSMATLLDNKFPKKDVLKCHLSKIKIFLWYVCRF